MNENIAKVNAKYRDAARALLTEAIDNDGYYSWNLDDRQEVQHVHDGAFVSVWLFIPKEDIANDAEPAKSEAPSPEREGQ